MSLCVRLLEFCQVQSNLLPICWKLLQLTPKVSFILVGEDKVSILETILNFLSVELNEEGGRQVVGEGHVVFRSILTNHLESLVVAGDEERRRVNEFGSLKLGHVLIEVRRGILASSGQVCAKRSLLFVNNDTARSRLHSALLEEIGIDLLLGQSILQNLTVVIIVDRSEVGHLLFKTLIFQHPVRGPSCVKGGSTWDKLYTFHLKKLWIERLLRLVGEAGSSDWQLVLLEKCLVGHVDLDIQQWVLNDEDR